MEEGSSDDGITAHTDYLTCVNEYYRYLNYLRDIHMGLLPQPNGFYWGDGIPRTAGGYPYEPLKWNGVILI